jgi:hypothetical protein
VQILTQKALLLDYLTRVDEAAVDVVVAVEEIKKNLVPQVALRLY